MNAFRLSPNQFFIRILFTSLITFSSLPVVGQSQEIIYDKSIFNARIGSAASSTTNFDELIQGNPLAADQYTSSNGATMKGSPEQPWVAGRVNGASLIGGFRITHTLNGGSQLAMGVDNLTLPKSLLGASSTPTSKNTITNPSLKISLTNNTIASEESGPVKVMLSSVASISNFMLDIVFDPNKLQETEVLNYFALSDGFDVFTWTKIEEGRLRIQGEAGSASPITQDGLLFWIDFWVKKGASGFVAISIENLQGDLVGATTIGSSITIPTPTPTPTSRIVKTPTPLPTSTQTPTSTLRPTSTPAPTSTPPGIVKPTTILPVREPHVFVYDNPNMLTKELTGKTDYDPVDNRNLTITCNADIGSASDWHVYVRKGYGGMKYLGKTGNGAVKTLDWYPKAPNLAAEFRGGPDFNSVYYFRMVRIDNKVTTDDYINQAGVVGFAAEGGNPIELAQPAAPYIREKKVIVCDDLFGIDDISGSLKAGQDIDPTSWRALQIVWNFDVDPNLINNYQVYVSVDGGSFVYLGQTNSGLIPYFWWTPNSYFITDKNFTAGPQNGHSYQFKVFMLPYSGLKLNLVSGKIAYTVIDNWWPYNTPTIASTPTPTPTPTGTPTAYIPPALGWVPFLDGAKEGSNPSTIMKEETTQGVMVNFDTPGMYAREIEIGGATYHKLTIPNQDTLADLGNPNLPILGAVVEVPRGVSLNLEIYKAESIELPHYNVIPAQAPRMEGDPDVDTIDDTTFYKNNVTYGSNQFYPAQLASVKAEDVGVIRGHRLVFLKAHPLQYNPVTKVVKAYTKLEVRITYNKPGQIAKVNSRIQSPAFESMLENFVLNFKPLDRFGVDLPSLERTGCDYLIITHGDFYNEKDATNPIMRFKDWKQRKGYITRVVNVASIPHIAGATQADDISAYIQTAYDSWYPAPTYVLLVGDADRIPVHYRTPHTSHPIDPANLALGYTLTGTDLYYTTVDGADYFPDILLGRISVDTLPQATTIFDKILNYEKNPPAAANFYQNTSLVRLFEDDDPSNLQEDDGWILIELAETFRDFLIGKGYTTNRIYNQSGAAPPPGPSNYEDGSNLPVELTVNGNPPAVPGFPWDGAAQDVADAFNNGNFLITYRGHGGRDGWSRPTFKVGNFNLLFNGNLTPVVFGLTCKTGWFDNETDHPRFDNAECFAESLHRVQNGGAVAIIASSRVSWPMNNFSTRGMIDALWPDFEPEIAGGNLWRMGQILNYGKTFLAHYVAPSDGRKISFEMAHLFGDPEMPMWIREPKHLTVRYPAGIGALGAQSFIVKVNDAAGAKGPVEGAVVALTRNSQLLAIGETNLGGIAEFSMTNMGEGDMAITVTRPEYLPYEGTIRIIAGGATLSKLTPDNGINGQAIAIGGENFSGDEMVDIFLGDQLVVSAQAAGGKFGLAGMADVSFNVPNDYPLGPANVIALGRTSNRYAVRIFQVRSKNPIDLYTYSQWDSTTWFLRGGDNPVWNNPEIQLYEDDTNLAVESNNLVVGKKYKVKINVHNDTDFDAEQVRVTVKYADFGIGQPDRVWTDLEEGPAVVDVPAHTVKEAVAVWSPPYTGHLCLKATIYHVEDINADNNEGQENCHIGPTSSPAKVTLTLWNPTEEPATYFLELRQVSSQGNVSDKLVWGTEIVQPDPQLIPPGDKREVTVLLDPDVIDAKSGTTAEFSLTGFVNRKFLGGVNFTIYKR